MRACYSPDYFVALPQGHRFPMGKFPALHRILILQGFVRPDEVVAPIEAAWEDLLLVHSEGYLSGLKQSKLSSSTERRIGLPVSEALFRRSRLATQGTVEAGRMALEDGIAANLAGGMHHGFPDHGEGFCVLNDVAVAVRVLRRSGRVSRILVLDLDVHQGNGTASIFSGEPSVYTFSMHGAKNFPFKKARSSLDVALLDGTGDRDYLNLLSLHLRCAFEQAKPDLIYYLAGVDPVGGDRFGRLTLSREGLMRRDRLVLETAHRAGVPIALLLSGGYAKSAEETADLHAVVHREAAEIFG